MINRISFLEKMVISGKLKKIESSNFSLPPFYREFVTNFKTSYNLYNRKFSIDCNLKIQELSNFHYLPTLLKSEYNLSGETEVSFQSLKDILSVIEDFPRTLADLDFELDLNFNGNPHEYLLIGECAGNGGLFLGIGKENNDKIYKIDFYDDTAPILVAENIFIFVDRIFEVYDDSHEKKFYKFGNEKYLKYEHFLKGVNIEKVKTIAQLDNEKSKSNDISYNEFLLKIYKRVENV